MIDVRLVIQLDIRNGTRSRTSNDEESVDVKNQRQVDIHLADTMTHNEKR
jgi:hypothetical protein